jgi:hypothetical protein
MVTDFNQIISGEQLQSLAQISLYSVMTDLIVNQNNSMSQNLIKISDMSPTDIKKYNTIFVYTQFLDEFFDKYFHTLNDNTVLITHNSDLGIHNKYHTFLNSNKIRKWYCQNKETDHPKLFAIPIGIANSQWQHGNKKLLHSIRLQNNIKTNLVVKNFDVNTNYHMRSICDQITNGNGIYHTPHQSIQSYWNMVSQSKFIISPTGNGVDCHRIWEALTLRCIPIVQNHIAFSQFKHLPILFVDRWDDINIEFLSNQSTNVDWDNIDELNIDYWKNCINI